LECQTADNADQNYVKRQNDTDAGWPHGLCTFFTVLPFRFPACVLAWHQGRNTYTHTVKFAKPTIQ